MCDLPTPIFGSHLPKKTIFTKIVFVRDRRTKIWLLDRTEWPKVIANGSNDVIRWVAQNDGVKVIWAPVGGEWLPKNRDFGGYFDRAEKWKFAQKSTFSDFHQKYIRR